MLSALAEFQLRWQCIHLRCFSELTLSALNLLALSLLFFAPEQAE